MNTVVFLLNILIVAVVSGGPAWKEVQRGGGLKVGLGVGKNATGSRGNGLRIGTGRSGRTSTTSTTMAPPEEELVHTPAVPVSPTGLKNLYVGIVVPYKSFGVREYTKAITSTKHNLQRKLKLFKKYDIKVHIVMKELTPSPTDHKRAGAKRYQRVATGHPRWLGICRRHVAVATTPAPPYTPNGGLSCSGWHCVATSCFDGVVSWAVAVL